MADILPFKKPGVSSRSASGKKKARNPQGSSLCRQGHHKWKTVTKQQFDVKQGKLVTVSECERCGKRKVKAL